MEKKLYLSEDKKLTGVCGGIAEYFGLDPTIIRLIAVLLALLFRWPIVVIYIFLWIILPSGPRYF